jgi:hypothetical protein
VAVRKSFVYFDSNVTKGENTYDKVMCPTGGVVRIRAYHRDERLQVLHQEHVAFNIFRCSTGEWFY